MLFRYLYRQSATTASVTHGLVRDTKLKPCTSKKKVCKEKVKRELTENQKKAHLKKSTKTRPPPKCRSGRICKEALYMRTGIRSRKLLQFGQILLHPAIIDTQ